MNSISDTIILCGGPINYSNLPIGTNQSNAMVPVNGKPVIGWILDDLQEKQIRQVTVVLREQDHRLQDFLRRAYAEQIDITIAALRQEGTIIQSLQAGLTQSAVAGQVRVVLGDTLISDSYEFGEDTVYVGEVEESRRWCLVFLNGKGYVGDYADKQEVSVVRNWRSPDTTISWMARRCGHVSIRAFATAKTS